VLEGLVYAQRIVLKYAKVLEQGEKFDQSLVLQTAIIVACKRLADDMVTCNICKT
jgi:hypothetical protein